jgi:hypothetical protein
VADPSNLSDDDLRERIRVVEREEDRISYDRRILHGRIDVVRSEILARVSRARGEDVPDDGSLDALTARLASALTHTGPPPLDAELEQLGAEGEDADTVATLLEGEEIPELDALTDADLAALARELSRRERETSNRRNELHDEIAGLRREHVTRVRARYGAEGGAEDPGDA